MIRTEELDYLGILCPLLCVQSISLFCPAGNPYLQVYTDYLSILPFLSHCRSTERAKELFIMKLMKNHGVGWKRDEATESIVFRKIYKNIDSYPLTAFVQMKEIDGDLVTEIRGINQICMSQYI